MKIVIIAAIAANGIIGHRGKIPWHISDDLQRFKRLTLGHPVIMGRRTFESLGKPLPGRTNMVLTRNPHFAAPVGVLTFGSLDDALAHCREQKLPQVFIIGGAAVYRQALPVADTLLLTEVHQDIAGDTRFPAYDCREWKEVSRENHPDHSFVKYERLGDELAGRR